MPPLSKPQKKLIASIFESGERPVNFDTLTFDQQESLVPNPSSAPETIYQDIDRAISDLSTVAAHAPSKLSDTIAKLKK